MQPARNLIGSRNKIDNIENIGKLCSFFTNLLTRKKNWSPQFRVERISLYIVIIKNFPKIRIS